LGVQWAGLSPWSAEPAGAARRPLRRRGSRPRALPGGHLDHAAVHVVGSHSRHVMHDHVHLVRVRVRVRAKVRARARVRVRVKVRFRVRVRATARASTTAGMSRPRAKELLHTSSRAAAASRKPCSAVRE